MAEMLGFVKVVRKSPAANLMLLHERFNEGRRMKKLFWFGSVILTLALSGNTQAVTVKPVAISVTKGESLETAQISNSKLMLSQAPTTETASGGDKLAATTVQKTSTTTVVAKTLTTSAKTTTASTKGTTASTKSTASSLSMKSAMVTSPLLYSVMSSQLSHPLSTTPPQPIQSYTPEPVSSTSTAPTPTPVVKPSTPSSSQVVPDGGATASLLGVGLFGTALMKRKLVAKK
jgi:hypothetical protein